MSFFKKLFDGLDKPIFKDWIFYLFLIAIAGQVNNALTPAAGSSALAAFGLSVFVGVPTAYIFFLLVPLKLRNRYRTRDVRATKTSSKKTYQDACSNIARLESLITLKASSLTTLDNSSKSAASNTTIFNLHGVTLREVREGTRTTETKGDFSGNMRSGTVGIGIGRVGLAATSGMMKGKTRSTSVSFPAPELITNIDEGKVVVQNSLIAFAGGKYSRSAKYTDLISWGYSGNQISFSVLGGDKVWILGFSNYSDAELVGSVLTIAEEASDHVLSKNDLKTLSKNVTDEISQLKDEKAKFEIIKSDYLAIEQ
ncbi:unannotated protein [freshwater metagenome]|uniref:Unannotated protein n=1 Tax=freshwater metagenome TaxID=449393 RepID=A0A6J7M448_9ZZZZ|nr:hypothetical protein [Actinomycetota bacterium]